MVDDPELKVLPKYCVGRCCRCLKEIFLLEEQAAHFMSRMREIESHKFSQLVFGSYIIASVYESKEKLCDDAFCSIKMTVKLDTENKWGYFRD